MGCLLALGLKPVDETIAQFLPVEKAFFGNDKDPTQVFGAGVVFVQDKKLKYEKRDGSQEGFAAELKYLNTVDPGIDFRDKGVNYSPFFFPCIPGCAQGLLDIKGKNGDTKVHIGFVTAKMMELYDLIEDALESQYWAKPSDQPNVVENQPEAAENEAPGAVPAEENEET